MNMKSALTSFASRFSIQGGLSYPQILRYFYPECITALIIYFLPYCIDCLFICRLESTNLYAISGIVENFLTMFLKAAEGLSIGTVIVAGYYNGMQDYKKAGNAFVDAFWTVIGIGAMVSFGLYLTVSLVCSFNSFSPEMISQGIPYLQVKSLSIFFMFVYFALVGFLRAIKKPFVPMVVFAAGSAVFVTVDYILIFGAFGIPAMCLMGSAVASLIEYIFMSVVMGLYVFYAKDHQQYGISLWNTKIEFRRIFNLLWISIPVVLDKVSIAFAYAWLGSCMSALGPTSSAAFSCVKLMERFAFMPGIACAQVITFLVSNDVGRGRWNDIHANIKRVLVIAVLIVGAILLVGSMWPYWFVGFFDKRGEFGHLVATIFPALSVLILIDLLQLILSGALRGVGDVKTVMWTRICVIGFYFIPMTYVIKWFPFDTMVMNMMVTYGAFLLGNAIMSMVYVYRLRQDHWKKQNKEA